MYILDWGVDKYSTDSPLITLPLCPKHNLSRVTNTPFTRYNRLLNRFDNRLYHHYHVYKHSTGCQIGLTTGCIV